MVQLSVSSTEPALTLLRRYLVMLIKGGMYTDSDTAVSGMWDVGCGMCLWFVVCDLWFVVCGLWCLHDVLVCLLYLTLSCWYPVPSLLASHRLTPSRVVLR
jgi:hypothetical protein